VAELKRAKKNLSYELAPWHATSPRQNTVIRRASLLRTGVLLTVQGSGSKLRVAGMNGAGGRNGRGGEGKGIGV